VPKLSELKFTVYKYEGTVYSVRSHPASQPASQQPAHSKRIRTQHSAQVSHRCETRQNGKRRRRLAQAPPGRIGTGAQRHRQRQEAKRHKQQGHRQVASSERHATAHSPIHLPPDAIAQRSGEKPPLTALRISSSLTSLPSPQNIIVIHNALTHVITPPRR